MEVGEKLAVVEIAGDADDTDHTTIHDRDSGTQGTLWRLAIKLLNVLGRGPPYCDRVVFSTDSISASAASKVQGLGAAACRHILESGSHSPPNGKSSSW